jgi:hypothetical protein
MPTEVNIESYSVAPVVLNEIETKSASKSASESDSDSEDESSERDTKQANLFSLLVTNSRQKK